MIVMNIFLVSWNMPFDQRDSVLQNLGKLTELYTLLDRDTLWSFENNSIFAASIHTLVSAIPSRVYVNQRKDEVTMFDGCATDSGGHIRAYHAGDLSRSWDDLPSILEGQFVAIRLTSNPPSIEVVNDFLGLYPVYYCRIGDTWFISNSVHLLTQISLEDS